MIMFLIGMFLGVLFFELLLLSLSFRESGALSYQIEYQAANLQFYKATGETFEQFIEKRTND